MSDIPRGKIQSIDNEYKPLEMANAINWENTECAIVLSIDKDGYTRIHVSAMSWRDRLFLAQHLQIYLTTKETLKHFEGGD